VPFLLVRFACPERSRRVGQDKSKNEIHEHKKHNKK